MSFDKSFRLLGPWTETLCNSSVEDLTQERKFNFFPNSLNHSPE